MEILPWHMLPWLLLIDVMKNALEFSREQFDWLFVSDQSRGKAIVSLEKTSPESSTRFEEEIS
jgi:hypothetical protein